VRSWSVSSVREFHACPARWAFRRGGAPEETRAPALVVGSAVHETLAHHLRQLRAGKTPDVDEGVALLRGAVFAETTGPLVRWNAAGEDDAVERAVRLYRHWAATFEPPGEIVAVEEEIRVQLPGIDLPLVAYPDVVFATRDGDLVMDHKVSAARPAPDELHDRLDLQLLALVHAWQESTGRRVAAWTWRRLLKLKAPALHDVRVPIRRVERERDLRRLAQIVNPTIQMMRAVLEGRLEPPPTAAVLRPCGGCPFRGRCASWGSPHEPHYAESAVMRSQVSDP
jgi:CRISPR/Cas system-associated exonuclease Cas4 (RecB family)